MKRLIILFLLFPVYSIQTQAQQKSTKFLWKRLSTEYGDIEIPNKGNIQTSCLIADFTKDGSDDFMIFEKTESPAIVMYVNIGDNEWEKHNIDRRKVPVGESAAFVDIDNDGDLDIAAGSEETNQVWWWENPYPKFSTSRGWKRNYIKNSGAVMHRDMVFGDFDGDNEVELAFWNQGSNALYVAEKPEDLEKDDNWILTKIYSYSIDGQMLQRTTDTIIHRNKINYHEGACSADIDNDGVVDIVAGGMWFKYQNNSYQSNPIDKGYVGTRVAADQLIEGGRPEVVMVIGDGKGPLVLYQYINNTWTPEILDNSTENTHSIQIIDFNQDGKLDIVAAEMKLGNSTNANLFILINKGEGIFEKITISSSLGSHNTRVGDIDGDGDYDIVGKPYSWDTPRLDIWLNEGLKK